MAKTVFRPFEFVSLQSTMVLKHEGQEGSQAAQSVEALPEMPEYSGPTADDLRREAEAFKAQWDKEKDALVASAKAEAERIVGEAESAAFEEVRRKTNRLRSSGKRRRKRRRG